MRLSSEPEAETQLSISDNDHTWSDDVTNIATVTSILPGQTMIYTDEQRTFPIPDPAIYFTLGSLVLVTGFLGNLAVICCWLRHSNAYKWRAYVIALASVDMLACVVVCPMMPLVSPYERRVIHNDAFRFIMLACFLFTILGYLSLLTATAVDRALAVFKPLVYNQFKRKQTTVCVALLCFCACVDGLCFLLDGNCRRNIALALFFIAFVTITAMYSAMAVKLWKQYNSIQPAPVPEAWTIEQTQSARNNVAMKKHAWKQNKALIATIKACASITVCFILSLILYIVNLWFELPWYIWYMYFINHVSTPVIHLVTNKRFRKDIKAFLRMN